MLIHVSCHFFQLFMSTLNFFFLFHSEKLLLPFFIHHSITTYFSLPARAHSLSLPSLPSTSLPTPLSLLPSLAKSTRQVTSMSATARFRSSRKKLVTLGRAAAVKYFTHTLFHRDNPGGFIAKYSYAVERNEIELNVGGN